MVGVLVPVEERRAARVGERVERPVVATLRHVRHALEHGTILARTGRSAITFS
jgi:hypothetical protein